MAEELRRRKIRGGHKALTDDIIAAEIDEPSVEYEIKHLLQ